MRSSYPAARKATRAYEGGKVDDPRDNGGRTAFGVTAKVYNAYRRNKRLPIRDVWSISEAEVDEIYLDQYWIPVRGDELPAGVDLMVFDAAIHSGPTRAIQWLQRALQPTYNGIIDGHYGEGTRRAVEEVCATRRGVEDVITAIGTRRLAFLKQLEDWPTYKNGWSRRVSAVTTAALSIMQGGPVTVATVPPAPKAFVTQVAARPSTKVGDAATGAGIATATMSGTLEALRTSLSPYAQPGNVVQKLVIALAILGALLAMGGMAWRWYQKQRQAERADALDLPGAEAAAAGETNARVSE